MIPPHLPPPTCNIEQHHKWQRLKIILIASFFGILAGVAGASVFIGWLWPSVAGGDTWVVARHVGGYTRDQLVTVAESKTQDKIYTLYRKQSMVGAATYFDVRDKIGEGILAISDGWLIAYLPTYDGSYKDWTVVSPQKEASSVERVLVDERSGFVYIKITPRNSNSTPVLSAATFNTAIEVQDVVFARSNFGWAAVTVEGVVENPTVGSHLDGLPVREYALSTALPAGSVVIDEQGSVVGFVDERGFLKPVAAVSGALSGIEEKTKILYPSFGVEGWFANEQPVIVNNKVVAGFVVTKVVGKAPFKKGDVLVAVNGRPADYDHVFEALTKQTVSVTVLRGSQTEDFSVTVSEL